jgi:2-oxoisovalerate dehydrogenase E1 component
MTQILKEQALQDYETGWLSRHVSLIGRKEVLTGKAKFGIFGDGKEVPQLAMARCFQNGDFRSGYYRDQTFMFATGQATPQQFFAQLYAHADTQADPFSGGRGMNCHFGSRLLDEKGQFKNQLTQPNSSSDISPTAGQMVRLLGLAYASKLYKNVPEMAKAGQGFFTDKGREVAFGTIGDASTSEGLFWETLNAASVLQVPMVMSVWDDGYGISVPKEFQTTKGSVSEALSGFQRTKAASKGLDISVANGHDYVACCDVYQKSVKIAREDHVPQLIHIQELTQPQGHSTSGSHERYKSKERLKWEEEHDCLLKMKQWILKKNFATEAELSLIESRSKQIAELARKSAWEDSLLSLTTERSWALSMLDKCKSVLTGQPLAALISISTELSGPLNQNRRSVAVALARSVFATSEVKPGTLLEIDELRAADKSYRARHFGTFNSHLHSETSESPLNTNAVPARYSDSSESVDARVVLLRCFEKHFARDPRIFALGEDVGQIGDVNLVFEGMQKQFGALRVTDTGIREASILGQGIGAALRGLRPMVDIQYLDYLLYALQTLSDDLACLHYRTAGGQKAPVIIRTKGHRLEGIWHTGSPISMILGSIRGVYVCVPRNCTQAAGMYNTLLRGDNPALVIEVLNGYRQKERLPDNLEEMRVPLGIPEVLRSGKHITLVTYGACVKVAMEACETLAQKGVEVELIDVQTLLPFDTAGVIAKSIEKTNAVMFFDEDVPGGATAYMMQQVLEKEGVYDYLDATPVTLSATANRSPYGSDGDYFSKPNAEDVVRAAYKICKTRNVQEFSGFLG